MRVVSKAVQDEEITGGKLLIPIQNQQKEITEVDQKDKDESDEKTHDEKYDAEKEKKVEENIVKVDEKVNEDDEFDTDVIMVRDVATQTPPLRGNPLNIKSVENCNINLQKTNNGVKLTPLGSKLNLNENNDNFNISDSRKVVEEIEAKFNEYLNKIIDENRKALTTASMKFYGISTHVADVEYKLSNRLDKIEESLNNLKGLDSLSDTLKRTIVRLDYPNTEKNSQNAVSNDKNDTDPSNLFNSTMVPESLKTQDNLNVKSMIMDELKKLGLSKDESNKDESIVKELKDVLKTGLSPRDNSSRRDYKLTSKVRFEFFMDYFTSELRAKDLLYVIDSKEKVNDKLDEKTIENHKYKVRDILINRIDQNYHNKIIELKDPVVMLNKIREIKRCESNLTSVSLRKQLYSIQYLPNKEKAAEFWDKFDEIISNYNNIPNAPTLSEQEIRDAFYQAIERSVPQVHQLDFVNFNMTGKSIV